MAPKPQWGTPYATIAIEVKESEAGVRFLQLIAPKIEGSKTGMTETVRMDSYDGLPYSEEKKAILLCEALFNSLLINLAYNFGSDLLPDFIEPKPKSNQ